MKVNVYVPDSRLHGTVEDVTAGCKEDKRRLTYIICSNADVVINLSVGLLECFKSPDVLKRLIISQIGWALSIGLIKRRG
jgi:hypothetical protein